MLRLTYTILAFAMLTPTALTQQKGDSDDAPWDVHDTPYEASPGATFQLCGNLTPRPLGLLRRSSGRADGPCSGGPQMPRSWTAVRPAGTGHRKLSSVLGCHRQSSAAEGQVGACPRGLSC